MTANVLCSSSGKCLLMASKQYLTLKISCILHAMIISFYNAKCCFTEFAELQKKSKFERAEWVRRQGMLSFFVLNHILVVEEMSKNILSHTGPHFVEYLSFEVTPECDVHLKCKVRLWDSKVGT